MTTARAHITVDQGADFGMQLIWTDQNNQPYRVVHPCRMQVRANTGQCILDVVSHASPGKPRLAYSTDGGVIQMMVSSGVTRRLPVGKHSFDLLASYEDQVNGVRRIAKVLSGTLTVEPTLTTELPTL